MIYFLSRLAQTVLVWLAATVVVFTLVRLVPGDPVLSLLPPQASSADIARYREFLGLDRPLFDQYVLFLGRLISLDLGTSIMHRRPVGDLILTALPVTMQVVMAGTLIAVVVAVPLGIVAARRPRSARDAAIGTLVIVGQSIPTYWLAILMIFLFSVTLHWLPTSGYGTPAHLVMPALSLVAWETAVITAVTRESLIEVFAQPYITTARSRGLDEARILLRHAMKNALIPILTVIALEFGFLLSGAAITEVVFGLPGIGSLGFKAILQRDYPVVQAIVLLAAAAILAINLLLDLTYTVLDPRIRYRSAP